MEENGNQTLEDISNNMKETEKNKLKHDIGALYNEIVVETAKVKPVIPETVFKTYFLDFFRTFKTNDLQSSLGLKWIELAGSVYSEVDIIDVNGNVVSTVPAIMSRPSTNEQLAKVKFDNIASTFEQKSNVISEMGVNYLNMALNGLDKLVQPSDNAYVNKWKLLFKRYNTNETQNTTVVNPAKAPVGIELNYD
jgi:hypothetical protein